MTGETDRPLGDSDIAVEILKLRVAELEQAIRRLAEQDATLSVQGGRVTVTMDATLTDAEREAIRYFAVIDGPQYLPAANAAATTLRVLLERTK